MGYLLIISFSLFGLLIGIGMFTIDFFITDLVGALLVTASFYNITFTIIKLNEESKSQS